MDPLLLGPGWADGYARRSSSPVAGHNVFLGSPVRRDRGCLFWSGDHSPGLLQGAGTASPNSDICCRSAINCSRLCSSVLQQDGIGPVTPSMDWQTRGLGGISLVSTGSVPGHRRLVLPSPSVLSGKFALLIWDGFSLTVRRATQEGRASFKVAQQSCRRKDAQSSGGNFPDSALAARGESRG